MLQVAHSIKYLWAIRFEGLRSYSLYPSLSRIYTKLPISASFSGVGFFNMTAILISIELLPEQTEDCTFHPTLSRTFSCSFIQQSFTFLTKNSRSWIAFSASSTEYISSESKESSSSPYMLVSLSLPKV